MAYTRKTSDIITSYDIDYILEQIKDNSEIARLLLKKRHSVENLVDNHINYISISNSDPTKISYLTQERIDLILSNGEDLWSSQKRYHIKPGSFVSKIFRNIPIQEIQNFSILYRNVVSKMNITFDVVSGQSIKNFYHYCSYSKETGSLGSSCMKYDSCQDYLDLYVKNPNLIKLLVALDSNKKLIGRALLWDDGVNKIMDRIYTVDDDNYQFMIKQWADSNGYWYKKEQRWNNTLYFESKGKVDFKELQFKLDKYDFNFYPYMDTFKFIDLNNGIVYNYHPKDVNFKTISSAEGKIQPQNIYSICDKSNLFFSNDSLVYIQNRNWNVSYDYCVYSEIYNLHILREDALYDQDLNDWIYQDLDLNNDVLIKQQKSRNDTSKLWDDLYVPLDDSIEGEIEIVPF